PANNTPMPAQANTTKPSETRETPQPTPQPSTTPYLLLLLTAVLSIAAALLIYLMTRHKKP
ncbi:MAG: hypothetical protein ABWK01_06325, partial [Infirmifilum sp.]